MFNKILLPVDGSKSSRKTWEYAKHLIKEEGSMVEFLYVNDDIWMDTEKTVCQEDGCKTINLFDVCDTNIIELDSSNKKRINKKEQTICEIRTQVKEYFKDHGKNITMKIVNGNPAHKIVTISQEQGFDVIIMATHGVGALKKFALGSVTHKVLNHSEIPVLLIR